MSTISSIGTNSVLDLFKKVDSDGSGDVSRSELQALSEKITTSTLDVSDEAFAGYDSDGDGTLSEDELNAVLDSTRPPLGTEGMAPPPPPPAQQATSAYADNSGEDEDTLASIISGLQSLLSQLQSGSSATLTASSSNERSDGFFGRVDTDSSGGVSLDELKSLAQNLNSMTGQSITVDEDTFSAYDSDSDGALSSDELKSFLDKSGFAPPPPPGGVAMGPPPEDGEEQATAASATSSGSDLVAQLQTLLDQLSRSSASRGASGSESLLSVTG